MPGKTKEVANKVFKDLTAYTVEAMLNADTMLKVFYFDSDLPDEAVKDEKSRAKVVDQGIQQVATQVKAKLKDSAKVKAGDVVGKEAVLEHENKAESKIQGFLVGKRNYILLAVSKEGKGATSKEAKKFFDSFKIIKSKAKE